MADRLVPPAAHRSRPADRLDSAETGVTRRCIPRRARGGRRPPALLDRQDHDACHQGSRRRGTSHCRQRPQCPAHGARARIHSRTCLPNTRGAEKRSPSVCRSGSQWAPTLAWTARPMKLRSRSSTDPPNAAPELLPADWSRLNCTPYFNWNRCGSSAWIVSVSGSSPASEWSPRLQNRNRRVETTRCHTDCDASRRRHSDS